MHRHFVDPSTMSTLPQITQYRPLLPLTLSLNYAIHGDSLPGYHLVNLALHLVTSVLVFFLCVELLRHWRHEPLPSDRAHVAATVTALLFAIHPVSGILVNYISGRDLLMMQLFLLASFLAYVRMRRLGASGWRLSLVLLLFVLSLLSKTNGVALPVLIFTFEIVLNRQRVSARAPWLQTLPFVAVVGSFFLFTEKVLAFSDFSKLGFGQGGPHVYPLTQARVHLTEYLFNVFWPLKVRQAPEALLAHSLFEPWVLLGALTILASLVLALVLRRRRPVIAFCVLAVLDSDRADVFPGEVSPRLSCTTGPTRRALFCT